MKPIVDKLLSEGDLFTLLLPTTSEDVDAYSFLIRRVNPISKEITEMEPIDAGGTLAANKLGESGHAEQKTSPGDDVFRIIETVDKKRVYHFSMMWLPAKLQIYWENPNGYLKQGFTRDTKIDVGDDEGFVWSEHTVYGDPADMMPSDALEDFIIPGVTPFIGFKNAGIVPQRPYCYILGAAYDVEVINAIDLNMAKEVALGKKYDRYIKTFGSLKAFTISPPDVWKDPVRLTPREMIDAVRR